MIRRLIIIAVCFSIGFAVEKLTRRNVHSALEDAPELRNQNVSEAPPSRIAQSDVPETAPKSSAWYEKEYRGDWDALFEIVAGKRQQDEGLRELFNQIRDWSDADKKTAFLAALNHEDRERLKSLASYFLFSLASESPELSLALFSELPATDQNEFAFSLINGLSQSSPETAWDWLGAIERNEVDSELNRKRLPSYQQLLIASMTQDPSKHAQALALSQNTTNFRMRETLMGLVVNAMVNHDVEQAMTQLSAFAELDNIVLDNVIQTWAENDVLSASSYLKENPDLVSRKRVAEVAKNLLAAKEDQEFLELYDGLESDRMKSFMAFHAAARNASADVNASIGWVKTIDDAKYRQQAAIAAIKEMGYVDTLDDQVLLIESAFADYESERLDLYQRTLGIWWKTYPGKVEEIIQNLPESERYIRKELERNLGLKSDEE